MIVEDGEEVESQKEYEYESHGDDGDNDSCDHAAGDGNVSTIVDAISNRVHVAKLLDACACPLGFNLEPSQQAPSGQPRDSGVSRG